MVNGNRIILKVGIILIFALTPYLFGVAIVGKFNVLLWDEGSLAFCLLMSLLFAMKGFLVGNIYLKDSEND